MALSLEQIRQTMQTSVHGRRLGIDPNDFLIGSKDIVGQVTNATSSTTATTLPNYGYNSVVTTAGDTWTLQSPKVGVKVWIGTASASTKTHTITPTGATVYSTNGIASSSIVLHGPGAFIELVGLTTSKWGIVSKTPTTTGSAIGVTLSS